MKMGIDRWFYWYVNPDGKSDLFQDAVTFGNVQSHDFSIGETGFQASNGTGLLVYPGTDLFNPQDSYGVNGPIASLRLKEWRRGLQDADYIALATRIDPAATQAIVNRVVPSTLWEITAPDPNYYTGGGPSWSPDPDVWEAARAQLATIIAQSCVAPSVTTNSNLSADSGICMPFSADTQANPLPGSGLPLTVTSYIAGAHFFLFGAGCPVGDHPIPSTTQVPDGTLCLIIVRPPTGFTFSGWADLNQPSPRAFVMSSQISKLTAEFAVADSPTVPVTLTASLSNVKVSVSGQGCPTGIYSTPSTLAVSSGLRCTFTPSVPEGYRFGQWSTGSTSASLTISVQQSTELNAAFASASNTSGSTPVSVTSNPEGASVYVFGQACSPGVYTLPTTLQVAPGTMCLFAIIPPSGSTFLTWSDGYADTIRTVIIGNQPITLQADLQ